MVPKPEGENYDKNNASDDKKIEKDREKEKWQN
jgi:hypothetical protein